MSCLKLQKRIWADILSNGKPILSQPKGKTYIEIEKYYQIDAGGIILTAPISLT